MGDRRKLAAWAGIAFVVLNVAQFALTPAPPAPDAKIEKVRAFLVAHRHGVLGQNALIGLAVVALVPFLVGLRDWLAPDAFAGTCAIVAGTILGAVLLVSQALISAPAWVAGSASSMDDGALRLAWSTANIAFLMLGGAVALLAGAIALGASHQVVRAVAIVVALVGLAMLPMQVSSSLGAVALFGFLGFLVLVLTTSVAMLRTPAPAG